MEYHHLHIHPDRIVHHDDLVEVPHLVDDSHLDEVVDEVVEVDGKKKNLTEKQWILEFLS